MRNVRSARCFLLAVLATLGIFLPVLQAAADTLKLRTNISGCMINALPGQLYCGNYEGGYVRGTDDVADSRFILLGPGENCDDVRYAVDRYHGGDILCKSSYSLTFDLADVSQYFYRVKIFPKKIKKVVLGLYYGWQYLEGTGFQFRITSPQVVDGGSYDAHGVWVPEGPIFDITNIVQQTAAAGQQSVTLSIIATARSNVLSGYPTPGYASPSGDDGDPILAWEADYLFVHRAGSGRGTVTSTDNANNNWQVPGRGGTGL